MPLTNGQEITCQVIRENGRHLHIFFKQEYYATYNDENTGLEIGAVNNSDNCPEYDRNGRGYSLCAEQGQQSGGEGISFLSVSDCSIFRKEENSHARNHT